MPGPRSDVPLDSTVVASGQETVTAPVTPLAAGQLLRAVFDHIPVMLLVTDPAGTVVLANRGVERVLGWSAADCRDPAHPGRCYPDPEEAAATRTALRAADGLWR